MANYLIVTIGVIAAMSAQEVRAAEQIVLNSTIQNNSTLEFKIGNIPDFQEFIDEVFIHTPKYRAASTRSQEQTYRVPRRLDKGNPATLSHPGRDYAMRMHGKDKRN